MPLPAAFQPSEFPQLMACAWVLLILERQKLASATFRLILGGQTDASAFIRLIPGVQTDSSAFIRLIPGSQTDSSAFICLILGGQTDASAFICLIPGGQTDSSAFMRLMLWRLMVAAARVHLVSQRWTGNRLACPLARQLARFRSAAMPHRTRWQQRRPARRGNVDAGFGRDDATSGAQLIHSPNGTNDTRGLDVPARTICAPGLHG